MNTFLISESDGTFDYGRWISGKIYDLQEILELAFKRQQYCDRFKALTGLASPWVMVPNPYRNNPLDKI